MSIQGKLRSETLDYIPIAPHLRGSAVLKMLYEEGEASVPFAHQIYQQECPSKDSGHRGVFSAKTGGTFSLDKGVPFCRYFGKLLHCATTETTVAGLREVGVALVVVGAAVFAYQKAKKVEWPPRYEGDTITLSEPRILDEQLPPPVPPRPSNYFQDDMEQQTMVASQQQQSSMEVRSHQQSYHYESYQNYSSSGSPSQPIHHYQQQSIQESSVKHGQEQLPVNQEYQIPIKREDSQANAQITEILANDSQQIDSQQQSSGTNQREINVPIHHITSASASNQAVWPPQQSVEQQQSTIGQTNYPAGFKLREQAPIEQPEQQVIASQPAFKITQPVKMRGDNKWPPKPGSIEEQPTQEEAREFNRPKKATKDYTGFFAQNALPPTFSPYRPPPGTQHRGANPGDRTEM